MKSGLYSIPLSYDFLEIFVKNIMAGVDKKNPLSLSQYTLYLPTQRAIRACKLLFLQQSPDDVIALPTFKSLGEGQDEDVMAVNETIKEPIDSLSRQFLLAKLIFKFGQSSLSLSFSQAFGLASEMMSLIDQVILEELSFDALQDLVHKEFAEHWEQTLAFMKILTQHWPEVLVELGKEEPATVRKESIVEMLASWEVTPPRGPVIVAGSTGSMHLTRKLMQSVLALDRGAVILPGYDECTHKLAVAYPTHPNHALASTVDYLDQTPELLVGDPVRERVLRDSFLPTLDPKDTHQKPDHISLITCEYDQEESLVLATLVREALCEKEKTVLLITPDRNLARRVSAQLKRWDILVNDSSGVPLSQTPAGILLRLIMEYSINPNDTLALIKIIKHPLCRLDEDVADIRKAARELEIKGLRSGRYLSQNDLLNTSLFSPICLKIIAKVRSYLDGLGGEGQGNICDFKYICNKLKNSYLSLINSHKEDISKDDILRVIHILTDLEENTALDNGFVNLDPREASEVLTNILSTIALRDKASTHPRVNILGPLEARLMYADRVILAGLNEGVWPMVPETGPWLSRPMRVDFGLQPLEQRIGLSAHDFLRGLCMPEVYLTRSLKSNDSPTLPCRWLLRLETLLGKGLETEKSAQTLSWIQRLDIPKIIMPSLPPKPCPSIELRPNAASVTQIELWRRDPYGFYAKHILKLRKLSPLNQSPSAADRGTYIHKILEEIKQEDLNHPEACLSKAKSVLAPLLDHPEVQAFWWPRVKVMIDNFNEIELHLTPKSSKLEHTARVEIEGFTLSAKADRLDFMVDKTLEIIDYKTGSVPTLKAIQHGYACQLPLEGVIAKYSGFVDKYEDITLSFWQVLEKNTDKIIQPIRDPAKVIESAEEGLKALISHYNSQTTAYLCQPLPQWKPSYSDYDQLARLDEWRDAA